MPLEICLPGGPDEFELVNLGAAILLAVALVPYAIQIIRNKTSMSGVSQGETGRDETVPTGSVVNPNGAHQNEDSSHGFRSHLLPGPQTPQPEDHNGKDLDRLTDDADSSIELRNAL